MKKGVVYGVFDKLENRIVYVGCTVNFKSRIAEHKNNLRRPQLIQLHIQEQGKENFEFVILEEKEVNKTSDLYAIEKKFIDIHDTFVNGFNGNVGGSDANKGVMNTNARRVICKTTGEVFATAQQACAKYGFDLSDFSSHLTKRKYLNGIGKRKHGVALFFDYVERSKDSRNISRETRKRISERVSNANKKKVVDLNTGVEYGSLKSFCESLGYNYQSVSAHLNGSRVLKRYQHLNVEYVKNV